MNNFDKQKQEIKNLIVKTFFNVAGLASRENKTELFDAVDKLHPPAMPACSECEKYNRLYLDAGECKDGVGNHWIINENEHTPLVDSDFGCRHHSDLEHKDG